MKEGKIKHIFSDVRFQLVYGVFLMVLIPFVIVSNTVYIINRYNETIDVSLQRQALYLSRMFYSSTRSDVRNPQALQEVINEIKRTSPDILSMHVLVPAREGFRVVASTIEKNIQQIVNFNYYDVAFGQEENGAIATNSVKLALVDNRIGLELVEDEERFWLVSMPLFDKDNNKVALVSIQLSSTVVDELTNQSWKSSVYSLSLTVLIAVLFLAASTRLWGYASLYKKIKEVDAMKDEFISIASHELRTPITAIRGYISMVLEGSFGEITDKARNGLNRVMDSAQRLAGLVEDLLDVSRIEQGRMQFNLEGVRADDVIREVVEELQSQAHSKNLVLEHHSHKEAVDLIFVDRDKCKQVLINIIGNAIKYTKVGSVNVDVRSHDEKTLEIRVKDTGVGMSAEAQKRLFEKFYRINDESTQGIVGTGLGLWITKQLVEMMKGKIYIESMEGVGSQVLVIFPLAKATIIQKK